MNELTCSLGDCVGKVAPYYNLILVVIAVILFIRLFNTPNKKAYMLPWKFLFFSVMAYILEEIITVIDMAGLAPIPPIIFPILEMVIITSFTYMVLLQKNYTEKKK